MENQKDSRVPLSVVQQECKQYVQKMMEKYREHHLVNSNPQLQQSGCIRAMQQNLKANFINTICRDQINDDPGVFDELMKVL